MRFSIFRYVGIQADNKVAKQATKPVTWTKQA